jgi:hypothetical protein
MVLILVYGLAHEQKKNSFLQELVHACNETVHAILVDKPMHCSGKSN